MKKKYINPCLTIVEMNIEAPVAASNTVTSTGSIKINTSTMLEGEGDDAVKGRGGCDEDAAGWGNGLW